MLLCAELGLCPVSSSGYPGERSSTNLASWCSCGRQIGKRVEWHRTLKRVLGSGKSHFHWHWVGQSYSCCRVCLQLDGEYAKCPARTDPVGRDRMQIFLQVCGMFWQLCLFVNDPTLVSENCTMNHNSHMTSDGVSKWTFRSLELSFVISKHKLFPTLQFNWLSQQGAPSHSTI